MRPACALRAHCTLLVQVGLRNEPAVSPEWDDIFKRAAANIDIVTDKNTVRKGVLTALQCIACCSQHGLRRA